MKTLYIIRHAKSSWDDETLADFDRPLNERGERDAPRMGKRLKEKGLHPDLLISSPAKRALSTCKKIAKVIGYDKERIATDDRLYHASDEMLLTVIQAFDNKHDLVFLFGHNPGLTEFINEIQNDREIFNIPTCGVAAITFPADSWKDVNWETGKLTYYDYPKNEKA